MQPLAIIKPTTKRCMASDEESYALKEGLFVSHANGGMCKPDWGRGGIKKKDRAHALSLVMPPLLG